MPKVTGLKLKAGVDIDDPKIDDDARLVLKLIKLAAQRVPQEIVLDAANELVRLYGSSAAAIEAVDAGDVTLKADECEETPHAVH